jgi:hypothetical protein
MGSWSSEGKEVGVSFDLIGARHEMYVPPAPEFTYQIRDEDYDAGLVLMQGVSAEHALAQFVAGRHATEGVESDAAHTVYKGTRYSAIKVERG